MANFQYKIHNGNSLEVLKGFEENSIDSIVCDPPYELGFMGKKWDSSGIAYNVELWKECLRVLKPGGHLLAFSGSRTYHRMTVAIEDAGFEIRDQIMWVYGSGFPKSLDISKAIDKMKGAERETIGISNSGSGPQPNKLKNHDKGDTGIGYADGSGKTFEITAPTTEEAKEWDGWGTALKPAHEPICLARKPLIGTVAENVLEWGTGGINIDGCRVESDSKLLEHQEKYKVYKKNEGESMFNVGGYISGSPLGRFPANLIHDGSNEVIDMFPDTGSGNNNGAYNYSGREYNNKETSMFNGDKPNSPSNYNDSGSASRFFYCAKASKKDRNEGLGDFEEKHSEAVEFRPIHKVNTELGESGNPYVRLKPQQNNHPTVKPTSLMQYLCRLVTPPNGIILDPFMGSGSTGKAAMKERFNFIGIDLDPEYCKIAEARIEYALNENKDIQKTKKKKENSELNNENISKVKSLW